MIEFLSDNVSLNDKSTGEITLVNKSMHFGDPRAKMV